MDERASNFLDEGASGTRKRRDTGATRLSKPEIQYGKKGLSVEKWKNK